MAISLHTAGSWAFDSSGSLTVALPTHSTGDMLIARVAIKSGAIATCDASTATAGWAKVGQQAGTTNSGNGTGSVLVAAFWKVAASGAETGPTIDFTQTNTQGGSCGQSYSKGAGESWFTPVGDGGLDEGTADTSHSATIATHVSVTAGDLVDFFTGIRDDTTMTVPTITQAGVTFAAVVESPATAGIDTGGADGAYDGGYRIASSGTSSAAAVVTGTLSTVEQGTSWMTRLRVFTTDPKTATPDLLATTTSLFAPTVTTTQNVLATPDVVALTAALFVPTVTASANVTATPDVVALTSATFAPTVSTPILSVPDVASLSLAAFVPDVSASAGTIATPDAASLTSSLFAPTVTATDHKSATPDLVALSLNSFAPTVTATDHKLVTPGVVALGTALFAPSIAASDHKSATPSTVSLTLTSFVPGVGSPVESVPATAALVTATFAPSVSFTDNRLTTPPPVHLVLTSFRPTVSGDVTKPPGVGRFPLPRSLPRQNVRVRPSPAHIGLSGFAPEVIILDPNLANLHSLIAAGIV